MSKFILKPFIYSFFLFFVKQCQAAIFALFLLAMIIITHYNDLYILKFVDRYDFLFCYAVFIQILLLIFKKETILEFLVILVFHFLAMIFEIFKTSDAINAWTYPEKSILKIANVPLFTGFMYSSVGSYISRSLNIFKVNFINFPSFFFIFLLGIFSYINFFSHHYIFDFRFILLGLLIFIYRNTEIILFHSNKTNNKPHRFYFLFILLGVATLLWIAENISTAMNIWLYPEQELKWQMVSMNKILSWFLLMHFSFVLIYFIKKRVFKR